MSLPEGSLNAVASSVVANNEEARSNEAGGHQHSVVRATLREQVAVAVGRRRLKTEIFGYIWFNISENTICYQRVFSSSLRSGVKKTPMRFLILITALRQRNLPYT